MPVAQCSGEHVAARGGPSQCSATAASEALCKFVAWTLYKTATALAAAALALAAARIVVNVQWRRKKEPPDYTRAPQQRLVYSFPCTYHRVLH